MNSLGKNFFSKKSSATTRFPLGVASTVGATEIRSIEQRANPTLSGAKQRSSLGALLLLLRKRINCRANQPFGRLPKRRKRP
jgi:hypothetical protein